MFGYFFMFEGQSRSLHLAVHLARPLLLSFSSAPLPTSLRVVFSPFPSPPPPNQLHLPLPQRHTNSYDLARSHGQVARGVRRAFSPLCHSSSTDSDSLARSIDETFSSSAVAVSWPKVFQTTRLTEVRQRKNSRSQSANLPGETRADLREHFKLQAINEGAETAVDD